MSVIEYGIEARYEDVVAEARAVIEAIPAEKREPCASTLSPYLIGVFKQSGLSSYMVPARFGGRSESVDPLAVCLVRETLMASSSQLDAMFSLQGIGTYALTLAGHPRVQRAWLPRIARGDALAAMALTEPHAGSDLKSVTTTIRADGDDVVIDGHKSCISHANDADVITVFGREGDGFSLVAVPAGTAGMTIVPGPALIAPHEVADVVFEHVRLPADYRVGVPGEAFALVLATLTVFRASVAGSAVGLAQAALDEAVRHCGERRQFGRPLYRLGPVAALLADSGAEVEMARLLAYRAATRARDGAPDSLDYSSMAKLATTEIACRVVDRCVQAMGRFGLEAGTRMGQIYLVARPLRIYEGASEVLRLGVARYLHTTAAATPQQVSAHAAELGGRSLLS
jgi:acyl-CoA dehydrogenase